MTTAPQYLADYLGHNDAIPPIDTNRVLVVASKIEEMGRALKKQKEPSEEEAETESISASAAVQRTEPPHAANSRTQPAAKTGHRQSLSRTSYIPKRPNLAEDCGQECRLIRTRKE